MISIDMDMPKSCDTCQFRYLRGTLEAEGPAITSFCTLKLKAIKDANKRADFCPLSEDDPVRAAKTIKYICWGFSDCEGCPFSIDNESKYKSDCMLLVPVHWMLSEGTNEKTTISNEFENLRNAITSITSAWNSVKSTTEHEEEENHQMKDSEAYEAYNNAQAKKAMEQLKAYCKWCKECKRPNGEKCIFDLGNDCLLEGRSPVYWELPQEGEDD